MYKHAYVHVRLSKGRIMGRIIVSDKREVGTNARINLILAFS